MKIEGSVALVTGGASGIGRAVCEAILERGGKVILVDIDKTNGEQVARKFNDTYGPGKANFLQCDISVEKDLEDTFNKAFSLHGQIHIICNNAGILDEQNWAKTLDINLKAVIQGTKLAIERMKSGVIINTSSTGGLHPASFCPVYCASKFGVVGFTRSIAPAAFRKKGIRINCVCPGATDTALYELFDNALAMELTQDQKDLKEKLQKQTPDMVAKGFIDLIKDDHDNGQVLKVTYESGTEYVDYHDEQALYDATPKGCIQVL